jgi:uncharacterized protein (TIGR02453 family)
MAFFTPDFLAFFKELAAQNNKEWFDANRKRYLVEVKEPFVGFVNRIISELSNTDDSYIDLEAKECIFRINRDIRFSKDKSPYKLFVSAVIAPDGKRSKGASGIYIEFGPEHLRIYGGLYAPDRGMVTEVREQIVSGLEEFQAVYRRKDFLGFYGKVLGEKNKILPAEWRSLAQEEPLLFNKQWYFYTERESEFIVSEELLKWVLDGYRIARPMIDFLNVKKL